MILTETTSRIKKIIEQYDVKITVEYQGENIILLGDDGDFEGIERTFEDALINLENDILLNMESIEDYIDTVDEAYSTKGVHKLDYGRYQRWKWLLH